MPRATKTLPYVPSDEDIRAASMQTVWHGPHCGDAVLIKTLLYTGVRVSELVTSAWPTSTLRTARCASSTGKAARIAIVPFPPSFKEALAHARRRPTQRRRATYLFESSWQRKYSERGVRRMLERYATAAGLARTDRPAYAPPFLLTWLKKQGIDDALIQPYSGHASRQSLEVYSKLAIGDAQKEYSRVIPHFPV